MESRPALHCQLFTHDITCEIAPHLTLSSPGLHLPHSLTSARCLLEACFITPWGITHHRGTTGTAPGVIVTGPDCRLWIYNCDVSNLVSGFSIGWACMVWVCGLMFYFYTYRTRSQLSSRPYSMCRAPNILLQLQVRLPYCYRLTATP